MRTARGADGLSQAVVREWRACVCACRCVRELVCPCVRVSPSERDTHGQGRLRFARHAWRKGHERRAERREPFGALVGDEPVRMFLGHHRRDGAVPEPTA